MLESLQVVVSLEGTLWNDGVPRLILVVPPGYQQQAEESLNTTPSGMIDRQDSAQSAGKVAAS
jgi:hypothetical protein